MLWCGSFVLFAFGSNIRRHFVYYFEKHRIGSFVIYRADGWWYGLTSRLLVPCKYISRRACSVIALVLLRARIDNRWLVNIWLINKWLIERWSINRWLGNMRLISTWLSNMGLSNRWLSNIWLSSTWLSNMWLINRWLSNIWLIIGIRSGLGFVSEGWGSGANH